jgi:hypothetical protein
VPTPPFVGALLASQKAGVYTSSNDIEYSLGSEEARNSDEA